MQIDVSYIYNLAQLYPLAVFPVVVGVTAMFATVTSRWL